MCFVLELHMYKSRAIEDLTAHTNKKGERTVDQNSVHSHDAMHEPLDDG
jgi:hypothetical protein